MQSTLDQAVQAERFSGKALLGPLQDKMWQDARLRDLTRQLQQVLGRDLTDYILLALVRATFLIELVKTPKIETTKFEVRWADRLPASDPRHCPFPVCLDTMKRALELLVVDLADHRKVEHLRLLPTYHMLPYEVPVDYLDRRVNSQLHEPENIRWFWDETIHRCISLRRFFDLDVDGSVRSLMSLAYDKIKVKTYLTDRVLTGDHKTNREKRWETHPGSVHFALRRQCMAIETALIEQACFFDGFPEGIRATLVNRGLLVLRDVSRCPITMEPLSFAEFERELRDPDHGKASFQVGHLNPLKALNDDPQAGHTSQNIAWVSADGNRIQGSLTLSGTRTLLKKIGANYSRFGV